MSIKPVQHRALVAALILLAAAGGFALDTDTLLRVPGWLSYAIPILLSVYLAARPLPFLLAAVFSLLTLAGFFLKPPESAPHEVLVSRLLGIGVFWLTAFIVWQRQRAEGKLKLFRALVERSNDAVQVVDPASGRFLDVNETACRMLGYTRAELLALSVFDVDAAVDRAMFEKNKQQVIGMGHLTFESRQRRKDGTLFPVEVSVSRAMLDREYFVVIIRDISERKQAEKQLRQLLRAVEHSPVSIVITDAAGHIEYVNPKFTEATGYSAEEVLGKNPRFLKSGEMPAEAYQKMWQVIKSGGEWRGEFHNRKKNGGLFWESASISAIYDDTGKIARFVAVKEDITEVKLAQEKLRLRESFLSAITENQPGLLWLKDAEGRFLMVNKAFAAACGRGDPETLYGLTDWDVWPEALARKYCDDDQRVMAAGNSVMVEEMIGVGNRQAWHETFKTPVRDDRGRVIGTTGYARDITARKQAEQQLLEAFSFNHKIISDAAVGIIAYKASGPCVLANEAAARSLNATVPQLLAQNFRQIASWRDSNMLRLAEDSLAANAPRQGEANFASTFGKEVSLVCHFNPFVQNGEPHLLVIFNDVTEKKKLEAQFLRAQRMESIGTLAGGIAHDFNNVLTPLLVSVQALKEKISDSEGRQILDTLEANVRRGASLVKQVLTFGRGIQGERISVQIKNIAREIEQIVQETFPKSVQFELKAAPDVWTVSCDPTQIQQVMLNLCVNARDAMPGGGTLSLHLNNARLDPAFAAKNLDARPGPYVLIVVQDTGVGIPKENLERIFEPFFTTKEVGKGTGLGLSTSLAIVKSHGGFIQCESRPGQGSRFKVYLPADASPSAAEGRPPETRELPRGQNEWVMIVDDEAPIREVTRRILERFGYRVLTAADGAEAVKLYAARRDEIGVVITDMAMPVMDGHATIAALRTINPQVKVIGSSGFDMSEQAAGAAKAGSPYFLPKPYAAKALLNALRDILRGNSSPPPA